jgi:hypothetical protein
MIFANVCRGLFEKDKMMFAFLITAGILRESGAVLQAEWSLFLLGSSAVTARDESLHRNPWPERITPKQWDIAVTAQVRAYTKVVCSLVLLMWCFDCFSNDISSPCSI